MVAGARASATPSSRTTAIRSVIVPTHDDVWVGRRRQRRARSPAIELREKVAHLGHRSPPVGEEGDGGARLLREIVVLALRVQHAREGQASAGVVAEELESPSQVHLRLGIALECLEEPAEVAVGPPRVGIGLQGALEPGQGPLAVAQVGGDQRAVVVRTRERRRQADRLVEQPRRAVDVAVAQIALAGDEEELLRALWNLTVATEANTDVARAALLVRGRGGDARALDAHEPPEPPVPLVREPLAVPPDAVRGVGLPQRGEAERLEDLVALGARARPFARLGAVVLAGLPDRLGACHPPGLLEVALFGQDVELDLHDPLERRVIAQERRLEAGWRPLKEPAYVARMQGQQAADLGQGPIVLAHAHRERPRP